LIFSVCYASERFCRFINCVARKTVYDEKQLNIARGSMTVKSSANLQSPTKVKKWVRRSLGLLAGLVCGVIVAEGAFWLRDKGAFPHINCYLTDLDLGTRLQPGATQRISFGSNPVTHVRINRQGFRGQDWPSSTNKDEVVVIGDSQVFGLGVEEGQTFSATLQQVLGEKVQVRNAGVPTYGPVEYRKLLKQLVKERNVKTVVYTINMVNDLFEARRPNTDRHVVLDGWAVRKENAPSSVRAFPGRQLLFRQSHAVFAWRTWWHQKFDTKVSDRGLPSEGTWQDLIGLNHSHIKDRQRAEQENRCRSSRFYSNIRFATQTALVAEIALRQMGVESKRISKPEVGAMYLGYNFHVDDILEVGYGENARVDAVTAELFLKAASERKQVIEKIKKSLEGLPDDDPWKKANLTHAHRHKHMRELLSAPLEIVRATLPILDEIHAIQKELAEQKVGLVLVVLPLDVQVSKEEWKKYNTTALDLTPTLTLNRDLVEGAKALGIPALDATQPLTKAEPGAFVLGDPHMSPKGHEAVGKALAELILHPSQPLPPSPDTRLPVGRSRMPLASDWDQRADMHAIGSTAAHCLTQRIREWYRIQCKKGKVEYNYGGLGNYKPTDVTVVQGGQGEVMVNRLDGDVTLVAPVLEGEVFKAQFYWHDHSEMLTISRDPKDPEMGIQYLHPTKGGKARAESSIANKLCSCFRALNHSDVCAYTLAEDEDCVRTYSDSCEKMIACASGNPYVMPTCKPGYVNIGARLACLQQCDKNTACPSGSTCGTKQGYSVCMAGVPSPTGPKQELPSTSKLMVTTASNMVAPHPEHVQAFQKAFWKSLELAHVAIKNCGLEAISSPEGGRFDAVDSCTWNKASVDAFSKQVGQVQALVKKYPELIWQEQRTLVEYLVHFDDWLQLAAATSQSRGTLGFFHELAALWNHYRPSQPTKLESALAREHFEQKIPGQFTDLWWNTKVGTETHYQWAQRVHPSFVWYERFFGPEVDGLTTKEYEAFRRRRALSYLSCSPQPKAIKQETP
jgi:hypothetical protein